MSARLIRNGTVIDGTGTDPVPDAAVLFAWNYHDEIVPRLRQRGFSGEIVLP